MTRVPINEVETHVARLQERWPTLTRSHICRLAGVDHDRLTTGQATMHAETAEQILAVTDRHIALRPPRFMPKAPVLRRIRSWLDRPDVDAGMVSRATGLSIQGLWHILNTHERTTVTVETYAAVMATSLEDVEAQRTTFPREPYVTKIRALQANGWPLERLAEKLGTERAHILQHDGPTITAELAHAIDRLWHELGDTPGGSKRAATTARALGYYPPICYDDDMRLAARTDADDAEAEQQTMGRRGMVTLGLSLQGMFPADIGAILGIDKDRVTSYRDRGGLRVIARASRDAVVLAAGQDAYLEAVRRRLDGIDLTVKHDAYDASDIDYYARFEQLRLGTWRTLDAPVTVERAHQLDEEASAA